MGVRRGTRLAIFGVLGALFGQAFQLATYETLGPVVEALRTLPLMEAAVRQYSPATNWAMGTFFGVIGSDLVTKLRGGDLGLGRTAGLAKGGLAAILGLLAIPNNATMIAVLSDYSPHLARWVSGLPGGAELITFSVGVWLGTVIGDVTDL